MTYVEKIRTIMQTAVAEPDFIDEDFVFWEKQFKAPVEYVNSVINMRIMMQILPFRYEGQEFRDRVSALDSARKAAHDSMVSAVCILNRFCRMNNLPLFADLEDEKDRYEVAAFAGGYIGEIYYGEEGMSFDEAVSHRDEPYSLHVILNHVRDCA